MQLQKRDYALGLCVAYGQQRRQTGMHARRLHSEDMMDSVPATASKKEFAAANRVFKVISDLSKAFAELDGQDNPP